MNSRTRTITGILALGLGTSAVLTGCAADDPSAADESKGTITLGFLPSWTDALSTAYLLEDQLTKLGYDVELEPLTEAGPLYTAVAQGDIDVYPSAWPEVAQAGYWDRYQDDLEDLGTYYEGATGTIAVPEYMDIDSIEDLTGMGDAFDGKLYSIEPGSGTVKVAKDGVFPTYGLGDEYELVTSSTAAMLAQIDSAVRDEEPVVVTLWKPFWANDAYGMKALADPRGGLGSSEGMHFIAHAGFTEAYPEAAEYIEGIKLDDAQYGALENTVVNEFGEGKEADAIDAWLAEHGDELDWLVQD